MRGGGRSGSCSGGGVRGGRGRGTSVGAVVGVAVVAIQRRLGPECEIGLELMTRHCATLLLCAFRGFEAVVTLGHCGRQRIRGERS